MRHRRSSAIRVGRFEVRSLATPGTLRITMSIIGTTTSLAATSPGCDSTAGRRCRRLFRPNCTSNRGWNRSQRMRALRATRLYLPHFGLVEGDLGGALRRARRTSATLGEWFRDELRKGADESELIPDFAAYEASDILESGAANERVADYETRRPKFHGRDRVDSLLAEVSSGSDRKCGC